MILRFITKVELGYDKARIEGHVRAVKPMVEEDTPCQDVLVQIAAVRAALNGVGRLILEDHMQGCMVQAAKDGDFEQAFRDLKKSLDQFIGQSETILFIFRHIQSAPGI